MNISHLSYFFIVFTFLVIPTLIAWAIKPRVLAKYKNIIVLITGVSFIGGAYWDIYAVKNNIWMFYAETTVGIFYKGVPLEEYLFIICAAFGLASITIAITQKK